MSNVKISALPSGTLVAGSEFPVNNTGTTQKITLATQLSAIATNTTNIATNTSNITTLQSQVIYPTRTAFVSGDFGAWSGGSITETVTGTITNYRLATETLTIRTKTKAIGSLTYTVQFLFGELWEANFNEIGLCFRESGTGKVWALCRQLSGTANAIGLRKGTQPTTFTSIDPTPRLGVLPSQWFFQIQYNGTDVIARYSSDGVTFPLFVTEQKTSFFTTAPDEVGLYMANSSGFSTNMSILSWKQA